MIYRPNSSVGLLCPQSRAPVVYDGSGLVSTDPQTRLRYPIRDNIPVMLVDEAQPMPADTWTALMREHDRDPETGQPLPDAAG